MASLDRFPDASDPAPNFMYGQFDLKAAAGETGAALGETLLALHLPEHPSLGRTHVHHRPRPQEAAGRVFLFSLLAAQPYVAAADDRFLNLLQPRTG